jgi:hypothetical protein
MLTDTAAQTDKAGIGAWNDHDPRAFTALFARRFTWEDVALPGQPMTTPAEAAAYAQTWFTALPDMEVEQTLQLITPDGWVSARFTFTGTNTGPFNMGGREIPATGRQITGQGCYFAHINDAGEIVHFITHPDVFGLMG